VGTTIVGSLALIHILTSHAVSSVAIFAHACVTALCVSACGISTALVDNATLVDVCTAVGGHTFETGQTCTFPGTDIVGAHGVITTIILVFGTLVDIGTLNSAALVTGNTFTVE
jgi:hypothetical protein